jgi:phosphatidylserine decarboxylase
MALLARATPWWVALPPALAVLLLLWPGGGLPSLGLAALLLLLALFLLNFFRDPERAPGEGIVSPADGVVQRIEEAEDGGVVVSIFMNVHDVHVNRAPCDGQVVRRTYHPGSHVPAWDKDSDRNERMVWDLATPHGDVRVTQIAGLLARRIVPYVEVGATLAKGQRFGIIRLGSRVDVALPLGIAPAVRVGDKVQAGSSTLALPGKSL